MAYDENLAGLRGILAKRNDAECAGQHIEQSVPFASGTSWWKSIGASVAM